MEKRPKRMHLTVQIELLGNNHHTPIKTRIALNFLQTFFFVSSFLVEHKFSYKLHLATFIFSLSNT